MNSGAPRPSFSGPVWTTVETSEKNAHANHNHDSHQSPEMPQGSPVRSSSASSSSSAVGSISPQSSVHQFLQTLGLSGYLETFLEEGFDRIDSIEAITENDLECMGVKRGHRRILQRALATRSQELSGAPDHVPVEAEPHTPPESVSESGSGIAHQHPSVPVDSHPRSQAFTTSLKGYDQQSVPRRQSFSPVQPDQHQHSWTENEMLVRGGISGSSAAPPPTSQCTNAKRKYQRHPKADRNAPEKPLSAYVMFSNHIREELKGQRISFTEIARLVGDRWKSLDPGAKEAIVRQAAEAKGRWIGEMDEYKKTPQYSVYQKYLKEFKESNGKSKATRNRISTSRGSTHAGHVNQMTYRPESHTEDRRESEVEEECYSDSEDGAQTGSKKARTSGGSGSDWNALQSSANVDQQPHLYSPPLLTLPTMLTPVSHARHLVNSQSAPRQTLLSATNNTFFENRSSSLRLPANLQHMATLSPSRDMDEDPRSSTVGCAQPQINMKNSI